MIHFQCPSCGSPFEVDDRLAGRAGRCKLCGGRMKIPSDGAVAAAGKPRAAAAPAAGPRLTPAATAAAAMPRPSVAAGRPTNWLDAVTSQVGLAPISVQDMKALRGRTAFVDEPSFEGPYQLAAAPSLPAIEAARGKPAGAVTRGYRGSMGKVQKLFRWINESAYLVSVPFLMCLLLGLATGSHSLMVLGATAVVVLNIGRIVAGVANLVVIPFRQSPIQGILFLIPPITFIYLWQNWHKVHKPVKRIISPILTIVVVVAAFVAEPWLRGEGKTKGPLQDQVKSGVGSLKAGMREKLGKVPNLDADGLKSLKNEAADALKSIEERIGDPAKLLPGPASTDKTSKNR